MPNDHQPHLTMITGATRGVGLECARVFLERGDRVLITGRHEDSLRAAAEHLGVSDTQLLGTLCGDIGNPGFAGEAMDFAQNQMAAPVSRLVNNAGTILRREACDTTNEEWHEVIRVNLDAVFFCSRAAARQMPEGGAIVNISSTCGQVGAAGLAAYCASKGAVDQLTRAMALELAPRKVTVNAVAPGAINSPMLFSRHEDAAVESEVIQRNVEEIPLGAVAEPEEVARAVYFLATERHITGEILSIDGGYTAR
jgi:NAD(P)-dependent dehydrogenase (short-subunit alcohol dehydrogenase family)